MCFCASFFVEEETKKERFFEAYEKGVRSTKDAPLRVRKKHSQSERLSTEEALVSASRLTPLGNSKKKKKVLRDEIVLKGRRDFHLYSVTLDFISVQRTNTKSALIITTT